MDYLLLIIGFFCVIAGVLGSFLPVLPGPPLSWTGILLLYFTKAVETNYYILFGTLFITIIVTVLDYIIPAKGTKRFGGSKYGIWGTNIGLVAGILLPVPFGFIIGPFAGAFIGELIYDSANANRAFKAAFGSFAGFVASSFLKFIVCMAFFGLFLSIVFRHRHLLF